MRVVFHKEAEEEFFQAIQYYEGLEAGLGFDFTTEVRHGVAVVSSYPRAWPKLAGEVRRCLVKRFPYGLLYLETPDGVLLVAVMHLHRHPDYWKHRIEGEA